MKKPFHAEDYVITKEIIKSYIKLLFDSAKN